MARKSLPPTCNDHDTRTLPSLHPHRRVEGPQVQLLARAGRIARTQVLAHLRPAPTSPVPSLRMSAPLGARAGMSTHHQRGQPHANPKAPKGFTPLGATEARTQRGGRPDGEAPRRDAQIALQRHCRGSGAAAPSVERSPGQGRRTTCPRNTRSPGRASPPPPSRGAARPNAQPTPTPQLAPRAPLSDCIHRQFWTLSAPNRLAARSLAHRGESDSGRTLACVVCTGATGPPAGPVSR